jgi:hypothetical protein
MMMTSATTTRAEPTPNIRGRAGLAGDVISDKTGTGGKGNFNPQVKLKPE